MEQPNPMLQMLLHVPDINLNGKIGHPMCCALGYQDYPKEKDIEEAKHVYYNIAGHLKIKGRYDKDDINNILFTEKILRISNGCLFLPFTTEKLIESIIYHYSQTITVVIPSRCFERNAETLYEVKMDDGISPDIYGAAALKFLSLIFGLLGPSDGTDMARGIIDCSPVDTAEEYNTKVMAAKRLAPKLPQRKKDHKKSGNQMEDDAFEREERESLLRRDSIIRAMETIKNLNEEHGEPMIYEQPVTLQEQLVEASKFPNVPAIRVSGELSNPETFAIMSNLDAIVEFNYIFPRYKITVESVELEKKKFCRIYQIRLLDPRLYRKGLANGIRRVCQINSKRMQKRNEKKTSSSDNIFGSTATTSMGKSPGYYFSPYSMSGYLQLTTLIQLSNILKILSENKYYSPYTQNVYTDAKTHVSDNINPCSVLSEKNIFGEYDEGELINEPTYDYGASHGSPEEVQEEKAAFNKFAKSWHKRYFNVDFYEEDNQIGDITNESQDFNDVIPTDKDSMGDDRAALKSIYLNAIDTSIMVYPYPNNVMTIPNNITGPVSSLCCLLPFIDISPYLPHSAKQPTERIKYPIQNEQIVARNNAYRISAVNSIIGASARRFIEQILQQDILSYKYFTCRYENVSDSRMDMRYINKKMNVYNLRHVEIIPATFATLNSSNYKLSTPMREMVKYAEDKRTIKGKMYIFLELYDKGIDSDTKKPMLNYHSNLTPLGNFLVNSPKILAERIKTFTNFLAYTILTYGILAMMRSKYGYQLYILFYGETATGKSRIFEILHKLFLGSGIVLEQSSSSQSKAYELGMHETYFVYVDDTSKNKNPILEGDKNSGYGGRTESSSTSSCSVDADTIKQIITSGYSSRSVPIQNPETGITQTVMIKSGRRLVQAGLTNQSTIRDMKPAFNNRIYPIISDHVPNIKPPDKCPNIYSSLNMRLINDAEVDDGMNADDANTGTEKSIDSITKINTIESMYKSLQIFSGFINYFISCGALTYNDTSLSLLPVMTDRLFDILEVVWPIKFTRDLRTLKDMIPLFTTTITIQRIWCNICSNAYTDINLTPMSPFDETLVHKIEAYNLLQATEEDIISAFSLMWHIIPTFEYVIVVRWILDNLRKQNLVPKYETVFNGNIAVFRPKASLLNTETCNDTAQVTTPSVTMGSMGSIAPTFHVPGNVQKHISRTNDSQSQPNATNTISGIQNYDPTFAVLSIGSNQKIGTVSDIEKSLEDFSMLHYPGRDHGLAKKCFWDWIKCSPDNEDEVELLNSPQGLFLRSSGKKILTCPIVLQKISADAHPKFITMVSISWLNRLLKPGGYIENYKSEFHHGYHQSPLEYALTFMGYDSCKKQEIVLPGSYLNMHIVNTYIPEKNILYYPKTIKYGSTDWDNAPKGISRKIIIPSGRLNDSGKGIFCGNGTYEIATQIDSLLKKVELGFYNFESGKYITKEKRSLLADMNLVNKITTVFKTEMTNAVFHHNIGRNYKDISNTYPLTNYDKLSEEDKTMEEIYLLVPESLQHLIATSNDTDETHIDKANDDFLEMETFDPIIKPLKTKQDNESVTGLKKRKTDINGYSNINNTYNNLLSENGDSNSYGNDNIYIEDEAIEE
jgi:hypothetical protein